MNTKKRIRVCSMVFLAAVIVGGCAHHATEREAMVFKDAEAQRKAEDLQGRVEADPQDVDGRLELGRLLLSEQLIEHAIVQFREAVAIDSRNIEAHLLLALTLQKRRNPGLVEIADLLARASRIDPENVNVHLSLAQVYYKLGRNEKAQDEFNRAIDLSQDPAVVVSARLGLAAIFESQGDSEEARKQYEAAREVYPELEEIIKQAEIDRVCPAPRYAGDEFRDDQDGLHPQLEERIKKALEEINQTSGERR
jgi:Tfp pilus assembly protein PilF